MQKMFIPNLDQVVIQILNCLAIDKEIIALLPMW